MSSYTTVLLSCLGYDDETRTIPTLNQLLANDEHPQFQRVCPDDTIYVLVGNYLPLKTVIEMIESVPWGNELAVQVWHRDEHHIRFTEAELKLSRLSMDHTMEQVVTINEDGTRSWDWQLETQRRIIPPKEETNNENQPA